MGMRRAMAGRARIHEDPVGRCAARSAAGLVAVLLFASCVDRDFQTIRDSIEPGQTLVDLLDGEVGAYLLEQGAKSFNGTAYAERRECTTSAQQAEWLAGSSPSVAIQLWSDGFDLSLSNWDATCGSQGCHRKLAELGPLTLSELLGELRRAGCALSAGMEFRLESPPRLVPPLTHHFFLIRFDERGRTARVSRIASQGDAAEWD